ncbi:MAG: cytochrome c, mono- and diheme variant family [Planctomycetota bacterium]|nr:cytochrome c, mono- and diheme variant family [Planctomycetota bacterium]
MIARHAGLLIAALTFAAAGSLTVHIGLARQGDEPEARAVRGRQLLQNDCFLCHTAEIISSQRLTPEQWKAEITKMVGWGAPVTAEEHPVLLDYLSKTYGAQIPPVRPSRITIKRAEDLISAQPEPADLSRTRDKAERGGRLFSEHCSSCHGRDASGGEGGTNLVEKPVINRFDDYLDVIRKGRNRMPGFLAVLNPEQEKDIFCWLLGGRPKVETPK